MLLEEYRQRLVECGRELSEASMSVGSAGNISVRIGDKIVITGRGQSFGRLDAAQLTVMGIDGRVVDGYGFPSSELPLHLAVYQERSEKAVVHTHSRFATVLGTEVDELPAIHYGIVALGGPVRVVPYATFGTEELADSVVRGLVGRYAVLLRNHGAVSIGLTLEEAVERAILLEWLCSVYWHAVAIGAPQILTESDLEGVANQRDRLAHRERLP